MAHFVFGIEMEDWITELAVQLCGGHVKKLYQMKSEEAMETSLFKRG